MISIQMELKASFVLPLVYFLGGKMVRYTITKVGTKAGSAAKSAVRIYKCRL